MKNFFCLSVLLLIVSSSSFAQWIPIDSIRVQDSDGVPLLLNQSVTTRGVVTTHREFGGSLVYFQVSSAGLVGFDTAFCNRVKRGDSIEVTGVVTQFSGLTELNPVTAITIFDTGNVVIPKVVTCTDIRVDGEEYEGMLIKIRNVTAVHSTSGENVTQWTVSGAGVNYRLLSGNDSCDIRIYSTTNIANTPVPAFPFDVVAVNSQFKFSAPFNTGYQILPRDLDDFSITTGINSVSGINPDNFTLHQNYPNPFNPNTVIKYDVPSSSNVSLKVYGILGNEVETLVNEMQTPGAYSVEFNGSTLSSGVYFYKITAGNFTDMKRMVLVK
ncbi:MAG: T9SS type A sorting domain-containing protein [Ignavibacteria bacterium]